MTDSQMSDPRTARPFAVITAFRAPSELADRIRALSSQVEGTVLVDDGSNSIGSLDLDPAKVVSIELVDNSGIAAALNVGIRRARDLGATHVVTLDQDSALADNYVNDALGYLTHLYESGHRPAAVAPARFGDVLVSTEDGKRPRDPIQSGQVVPMAVFDAVGDFDERLFIDAVDTEFTLRARAAGYDFWLLPGSELEHSLGEKIPVTVFGRHLSVFGKKRHLYYHAPFRTYYAVRNGLALWRLHGRRNALWLARRTVALMWVTFLGIVLSPDRGAQFAATGYGLRHGLTMRLGKIPPAISAALSRLGR